jgi:hypothetical protein
MQVNEEMNFMSSTKKGTMMLKCIVSRISIAALVVIVVMAGSAAAASKGPRPMVISSNPADDAIDVPVNASVTVNFSLPMNCNSINKNTFRLKVVKHGKIPAVSVTCSGASATLTPLSDLSINTRYQIVFHDRIAATSGATLWNNGNSFRFTTGPGTRPPATATPTPTATSTATSTATATATSTPTATATATGTSTATATATNTPTATSTASATATATDTATATSTATDTATATASSTPTRSATVTATSTSTAPVTSTATATATASDTPSATATATDSATATATDTPTTTASATATDTPTATSSATATATATATPTATPTAVAPTVISSAPAIVGCGGQGMGTSQEITATFSEPMISATILASGTFTVSGPSNTPIAGTVSYDMTNNTATFAVTGTYPAGLLFTATITTAAESLSLLQLASNYVWTFTSGAGPVATKPSVISTNPAAGAPSVDTNQKIVATFDKGMDSTTLTGTTFTVLETVGIIQVPVPGVVTYSTIGDTATFTPSSVLDPSAMFTATITTGVTDLSGNPLANNFIWTFTTGTTTDSFAPSVTSSNPAPFAFTVGIDASVNATFSEAMDPSTLNPTTFVVTGPGSTIVIGKVSYDVPDQIVTFTPTSPLAANTFYNATITGAQDLAGNLLPTFQLPFHTGSTPTGQSPVNLGSASSYAILAATTVTAPGAMIVNGDLGVWPGTAITGFPPAFVNGNTNLDNTASGAAQADLLTAFDYLMNTVPPGAAVAGNIGGTTPPPGVYTSTSTLAVTSGNLTLDAQGDVNAVWIFQIGTALDVTTQVILTNGAQASNVFWEVGSSATIDVGAVMQGNILALTSITANGGATLNGRALALNGAVTAGASSGSLPICQ